MSVPNQIPESSYVGNGTTTTFAANFEYASDSDVFVTVDGVTPEIGQATFANGVFTFTTAPASGAAVRVYRSTPIERDTEYDNHDNVFRPRVVNTDFDRIWFVLQEYLLSLGITNARITQEIADRIQADAEMMNYILNEDNELKADYILRDENLKTDYIYRDENLKKYVDQTLGALSDLPDFQGIEAQFVKDSSGKDQQQINDKIKREFTSVWDFFTVAELGEYRSSPNTFDAARPLQAFFDYIAANNVGCAYADAEIWVKSAITFGGASGSLTKHVKGYLKITAINTSLTATPPIETLFTFQPASNLRWEGVVHVVGSSVNALNYDRRHVRNGIQLGGEYSATHSSIDFIIAENGFKEYGIVQGNLTTGLVIGKIRGTRSGSGYVVGGYTASLYSDFTRISDTSGTGTQRTTISVVNFADYKSQVGYVVINGEAYLITSKNEAAKTLEIFPSLPTGVTTGNLKYAFGGVFYTTGGDASVANIGNINCSTSGISVQLSALYPPTIGSITTQNNFCALSLGASISAGLEGGTIGELYFEALEFGIIQNTRYAATNITITNNVGFNPDNCIHIGNYRASDGSMDRTYPLGINIVYEGVSTQIQDFRTANTITVPIFSPNSNPIVCAVFTQPKIVNLTEGKKSLHRLFGYSNRTIKFVGATGSVTQSITFNPPAGYTLNNQSSPLVFSNIGGTPVFEVIYHSGMNVTVNLIGRGQLPSNSVTYDPPSLNASGTAGDSVTTTVTLTGAVVGNVVQAAFSQYNANIEISAQVSAANTVTVKFKNTSAAAVDLPSGTLTVKTI